MEVVNIGLQEKTTLILEVDIFHINNKMKEAKKMTIHNNFNFCKNGFLIKRLDSNYASNYKDGYLGIEGDTWPLDIYSKGQNTDEIQYLSKLIDDKITRTYYNDSFVGVCEDKSIINKYISMCKNLKYKIDVLFCETTRKNPLFRLDSLFDTDKFIFIGYDYGDSADSYYSCVYNDVYIRNLYQFSSIVLNENGLINDEEVLSRFIDIRDRLKTELSEEMFEHGNFIPYKLWKYVGNQPL